MRRTILLTICLFALAACSDSGPTPDPDVHPSPSDTTTGADSSEATDTDVTLDQDTGEEDAAPQGDSAAPEDSGPDAPPAHPLRFGISPGQAMSTAPFPSDLYLNSEGTVAVPPLGDDPVLGEMAKPEVLALLDTRIAARRGFGFANPVHFFANEPLDAASAAEHVVILTLSGPEAGRIVTPRAEWAPYTQSLAISPAWGDYMMPNATYAVLLMSGIQTTAGETITAHEALAGALAEAAPAGGEHDAIHGVFAPLWAWLTEDAGATLSPESIILATVFTTEATMPTGQAAIDAIDAYTLKPPTRQVGWDTETASFIIPEVIDGDALETYFGVPTAPFEHNPGSWNSDNRVEAAHFLDGDQERYEGGSFHAGIGRVINGSILAPALTFTAEDGDPKNVPLQWDDDGAISWSLEAMIPFTLFLCEDHLQDASNLPVAVFTHGGTGHRTNGLAWANLNCQLGVATITYDNIFHGGRITLVLDEDEQVILPVRKDELNEFTGLSIDDAGFVADYAGDNGGGPETVGQLFALPAMLDPGIGEGNLITMATDTHALVRVIKEGDWSQVQGGLSFDAEKVFHQGLSYGTSFTTPLLALTQDFVAEIWSVGSGAMIAANLGTAPVNADLATGFMRFTLGLKPTGDELIAALWLDPIAGILQWLTQRGDPIGYAPYVLRHRDDGYELPIIATGDSWDETLGAAAQMTFGRALGLPVYSAGEAWTLHETQPALASAEATPYGGEPLSANVTFGDRTHSAALFYARQTCHAMQIRPVCAETYAKPYPPITPLPEKLVDSSPVCAIQSATKTFMASVLAGATHPEIVAPEGTCEDLYAP